MEKQKAVEAILEVLKSVQELSGRKVGVITAATCPIGDLDEFDSLSGVEASSMLSGRIGFEIPGVNAFVNEKGTKALSVDQIADAICRVAAEAKA
ncbi:MAG: hypothetical protein KDA93_26050 [Planctomycetaceae bacterium]|nr:hypothetical protein [Planctomycetaceae bacterium]